MGCLFGFLDNWISVFYFLKLHRPICLRFKKKKIRLDLFFIFSSGPKRPILKPIIKNYGSAPRILGFWDALGLGLGLALTWHSNFRSRSSY